MVKEFRDDEEMDLIPDENEFMDDEIDDLELD